MNIFPTKILLATDGSGEADLALLTAVGLSNRTDSELHVVHVGGEYHPGPEIAVEPELLEETLRELEREAQEVLDEQVKKIEEAGGTVAEAHLRMGGRPNEQIVALAEEIGAGLISMGSRGLGGIERALMGSVSGSVVRHAHCPVLIVREEAVVLPTKILLATDDSEEAAFAAQTVVELAQKSGSELHLVHVGETLGPGYSGYVGYEEGVLPSTQEELERQAQETLEAQVKRITGAEGTRVQSHLRLGRPDIEIITLGEEIGAGLIVMGSRGRGGLKRALMGSVSESVVRHAHCPVLVVRNEKQRAKRR